MKTHLNFLAWQSIFLVLLIAPVPGITYSQVSGFSDTVRLASQEKASQEKRRFLKMTTLTFGGSGLNFTRVNDQLSVMTGGRGSATFNNRYTIGGGGWGMIKAVSVESSAEGLYNFVKMGYGGIDLGYLVIPGDKFNLGTRLMLAGGAVFRETVPKSADKSFKMFPVIEPALYYQISLGKLFRFEMGASYRYIWGTKLPYISDGGLSGFSCYIAFLVGAANRK